MNPVAEIVISILLVMGGIFILVGSWGLARLPSLMTRLHGPTKATTLGVGAMLVGSMVFFRLERGEWSGQELLISLFLFITAPIAISLPGIWRLENRITSPWAARVSTKQSASASAKCSATSSDCTKSKRRGRRSGVERSCGTNLSAGINNASFGT